MEGTGYEKMLKKVCDVLGSDVEDVNGRRCEVAFASALCALNELKNVDLGKNSLARFIAECGEEEFIRVTIMNLAKDSDAVFSPLDDAYAITKDGDKSGGIRGKEVSVSRGSEFCFDDIKGLKFGGAIASCVSATSGDDRVKKIIGLTKGDDILFIANEDYDEEGQNPSAKKVLEAGENGGIYDGKKIHAATKTAACVNMLGRCAEDSVGVKRMCKMCEFLDAGKARFTKMGLGKGDLDCLKGKIGACGLLAIMESGVMIVGKKKYERAVRRKRGKGVRKVVEKLFGEIIGEMNEYVSGVKNGGEGFGEWWVCEEDMSGAVSGEESGAVSGAVSEAVSEEEVDEEDVDVEEVDEDEDEEVDEDEDEEVDEDETLEVDEEEGSDVEEVKVVKKGIKIGKRARRGRKIGKRR
jgi:hypothetical protein